MLPSFGNLLLGFKEIKLWYKLLEITESHSAEFRNSIFNFKRVSVRRLAVNVRALASILISVSERIFIRKFITLDFSCMFCTNICLFFSPLILKSVYGNFAGRRYRFYYYYLYQDSLDAGIGAWINWLKLYGSVFLAGIHFGTFYFGLRGWGVGYIVWVNRLKFCWLSYGCNVLKSFRLFSLLENMIIPKHRLLTSSISYYWIFHRTIMRPVYDQVRSFFFCGCILLDFSLFLQMCMF